MSPLDRSSLLSQASQPSLETLGDDYRATRAIWIACLAIVLYDYALTLDEELRYYKGTHFGWSKAVFLVACVFYAFWLLHDAHCCLTQRATPKHHSIDNVNAAWAMLNPSKKFCEVFFNWVLYAAVPTHITIGVIQIVKITAMYSSSRWVLWGLGFLLAAEIIAELSLYGPLVAKMSVVALPAPLPGCPSGNDETHTWAYWFPAMAFESLLFILALVKTIEEARAEYTPCQLMTILLRDSFTYFAGIFALIAINFVIWASARESLFAVAIGPVMTAYSVLGCRMLLNIYEVVELRRMAPNQTSIVGCSIFRRERITEEV